MNSKKIAIIGSGISGLITGLVLQENNDVTIFEKNDELGGVFRDSCALGYDNNFLYLDDKSLNGIINDGDFIYSPYLIKYNFNGKEIYLYQDINKLNDQLIEYVNNESISKKEDLRIVNRLIDDLKKSLKYDYNNEKDMKRLFDSYGSISIKDYFKDFSFRAFVNMIDIYFQNDNSFVYFLIIYSLFIDFKYKRITNGVEFIEKLKRRFIDLGGKIRLNYLIDKYDIALRNDDNIIKIKDENFDYLIGSCDLNHFYDLLGRGNRKLEYMNQFINVYSLFSLSFEAPFKDDLSIGYSVIKLDEKDRIKVGAKINDKFKIIMNKNIINVSFNQERIDYEYFKILKKNDKVYQEEINRIINETSNILRKYLKIDNLNFIEKRSPIDFEEKFNIFEGGIKGYYLLKDYLGIQFMYNTDIDRVFISSSWQRKPFFVNDCYVNALKIKK